MAELGATAAMDTNALTVPTRPSTVANTLTARGTPALTLLVSEVDELHCVLTVNVPPMRPPGLQSVVPPLTPTTVTDVEPVDAAFVAVIELASVDANVKAAVVVAPSFSTVDATERNANTLSATLATTLVSERHVVARAVLTPNRTLVLRA